MAGRLAAPGGIPGRWTATLVTREVLCGLVVAFALMPESISFAVAAGVPPQVGLLAAATMACATSLVGGRPAMISGAAGSVALVVAPLSHHHGLPYLIAAIVLGGVLQVLFGLAGVPSLMRFVPRGVLVGFVNALAILIFSAQLPNLVHVGWAVYPLVAAGLAIIVLFPRLTRAVPAPLAAVVALTVVVVAGHVHVPDVADKGGIAHWGIPHLALPGVPIDLRTLRLVLPYSVAVAVVGMLESLMTAQLVDDLTGTPSSKTRETWGQGVANVLTGLCGGMGGCAMIGQTLLNVKTGGRTRLSTFSAGAAVFVLVGLLGSVVGRVPMAALVAVMLLVAWSTFDWHSIRPGTLRRLPRGETAVMLVTVGGTVASADLAVGVLAGVLVATLLFARRVAHLTEVDGELSADGRVRTYRLRGQLFFASVAHLADHFDFAGDPDVVRIDLGGAHVWDASTVAALDAVVTKYSERGKVAEVVNLDVPSDELYRRLSGQLGAG